MMSNSIEAAHWTKIQKLKQYIKGVSLSSNLWRSVNLCTVSYLRRQKCENFYENTIWKTIYQRSNFNLNCPRTIKTVNILGLSQGLRKVYSGPLIWSIQSQDLVEIGDS